MPKNVALIETGGKRQQRRLPNTLDSMVQFIAHLQDQPQPVRIAFEPTGCIVARSRTGW